MIPLASAWREGRRGRGRQREEKGEMEGGENKGGNEGRGGGRQRGKGRKGEIEGEGLSNFTKAWHFFHQSYLRRGWRNHCTLAIQTVTSRTCALT